MSFGYGFSVTRDGGRRWRELRDLPVQLDGGGSILHVDGSFGTSLSAPRACGAAPTQAPIGTGSSSAQGSTT